MEEGKQEQTELSLEEAFDKLDEILADLESDALSLEDSFTLYQKGMQLVKGCSEKIDTVEKDFNHEWGWRI